MCFGDAEELQHMRWEVWVKLWGELDVHPPTWAVTASSWDGGEHPYGCKGSAWNC